MLLCSIARGYWDIQDIVKISYQKKAGPLIYQLQDHRSAPVLDPGNRSCPSPPFCWFDPKCLMLQFVKTIKKESQLLNGEILRNSGEF